MDYRGLRLLLGYVLLHCSWLLGTHGQADHSIELNSFQPMSNYDSSWLDWDTLRLKKISRTELGVTGDCELKQNLGDEQRVVVQVFSYDRENKRRGPMVFQVDKPFCEMVGSMMETYRSMALASNLPEEFSCPHPKGSYSFKNFALDTDFLPADTPKGNYLVTFILKNAEKAVSGFEIDLTVA